MTVGEALWRVDGQTKIAVPLLIQALTDHAYLTQQSARTLGQIGPAAKDAVPALIKAARDKKNKPLVQAEAAQALKKIDPEAAAKLGIK